MSTPSPNGVVPSPFPPDPPRDPPDPLPTLSPHTRLSTQSVTSLTSSRPAPPSPAVSRRASGLSRASSRPVSDTSSYVSSRPTSGLHLSRPASGTSSLPVIPRHPLPSPALTPDPSISIPTATSSTTPTTPPLIQIRDYGFDSADPRFTGHGPLVPRANRPAVLARRLAGAATPTSAADDDDDDDDDWEDDDPDPDRIDMHPVQTMWENAVDDGTNGWGGFKWGLGRGWGFGSDSGGPLSSPPGFPSRGDLDRNFGAEDDDIEMDEEGEAFSEDVVIEGEPPLFPGLYRAVYPFEPEGTAEMKLDEDQLVRVIGRGGGVGWAVVVKDGLRDTGVHALVPESYLEVVRLDGDEDSQC